MVNTFPPAPETGEETPSGSLVRVTLERFARRRADVEGRIVRFLRQ